MSVRFDLSPQHRTNKPATRQRPPPKSQWPPNDYDRFRSMVDDQLSSSPAPHNIDERHNNITTAIIDATRAAITTTYPKKRHDFPPTPPQQERLRQLILQRQQTPNNSSQRKTISLAIRKQLRHIRQIAQESRIEEVILKKQGLRHITREKHGRGKDLIASMSTFSGATVTNRQSIADVFADFYSQLYQRLDHDQPTAPPPVTTRKTTDDAIPPFTLKELNSTIAQLRSGRCRDTTGLLAEMLKQGGNTLRGHLLQLYNDILQPNAQPPASWRQSTISIIFKSGDPQLPNNYRPISIIPLLYKLFARLLYNRIEPQLDKHQTPDQAGFRHDYSTDDHLYTTTLIHERSHEWQLPLWVSAVDFKKAFDTIDHKCLWQALARQNLPPNYIHLLQKLYDDLTAVVKTDK